MCVCVCVKQKQTEQFRHVCVCVYFYLCMLASHACVDWCRGCLCARGAMRLGTRHTLNRTGCSLVACHPPLPPSSLPPSPPPLPSPDDSLTVATDSIGPGHITPPNPYPHARPGTLPPGWPAAPSTWTTHTATRWCRWRTCSTTRCGGGAGGGGGERAQERTQGMGFAGLRPARGEIGGEVRGRVGAETEERTAW